MLNALYRRIAGLPSRCNPLASLAPGHHALLAGGDGAGLSEVLETEVARRIDAGEAVVYINAYGNVSAYAHLYGWCDAAERLGDLRCLNVLSVDDDRDGTPLRSHRLPVDPARPLPADMEVRHTRLFGASADISLTTGNPVLVAQLPVVARAPSAAPLLRHVIGEVAAAAQARRVAGLAPLTAILLEPLSPGMEGWLPDFLDAMAAAEASVVLGANLCCSGVALDAATIEKFDLRLRMKGCDDKGRTIPHEGLAVHEGTLVEMPYRKPPSPKEIRLYPRPRGAMV